MDSSATEPPTKRRRIAIACDACRIRKSRCNGAMPKCSLCENLGFECKYNPSDSTTNVIVRKEVLAGLEQRLQSLEDIVQRHDQLLTRSTFLTDPEPHLPSNNTFLEPEDVVIEASDVQEVDAESAVDGMAVTFLDEQDSGYFGSSSNISFMRHIFRAMSVIWSIRDPTTPMTHGALDRLDNGIINASRRPSPIPETTQSKRPPVSAYKLPHKAELESLLRAYFDNTGLLFPFIHPPSFMETYRVVSENNFTKVRRTWLGLLNMMLAMAVSTETSSGVSAPQRIEKSEVFCNRATALCNTQMLRGTNIEIVQYLLLMSQYLQGTHKSVQTWIMHGLAVKAALSLGLQSDIVNTRFSPIEQEVRRRTWYGCVILDRNLCLTFGRPSSIPEEYVRIPLPSPWPLGSDSDFIDEAQIISTLFYVASIDLYKILHDVLVQLFDQNLGCGPALSEMELTLRVFHLEQELSRWQALLDPRLVVQNVGSLERLKAQNPRSFSRCNIILTVRYLHLDVLVHRPFLSKVLDLHVRKATEPRLPPAAANMAAGAIKTCLGSAESIIAIVHAVLSQPNLGKDLLGAWWFTLFYVFSAALTVFAGVLQEIGSIDAAADFEQKVAKVINTLAQASSSLKALDTENQTVTKCQNYLEYLIHTLERCVGQKRANEDLSRDASSWNPVSGLVDEGLGIIDDTILNDMGFGNILNQDLNVLNGDLEMGQLFLTGI